ncbi:MAG: hypothetical protein IKR13_01135 [Victivallales bacterium]|nr:hypothetical protein [Victivallales bacterium]
MKFSILLLIHLWVSLLISCGCSVFPLSVPSKGLIHSHFALKPLREEGKDAMGWLVGRLNASSIGGIPCCAFTILLTVQYADLTSLRFGNRSARLDKSVDACFRRLGQDDLFFRVEDEGDLVPDAEENRTGITFGVTHGIFHSATPMCIGEKRLQEIMQTKLNDGQSGYNIKDGDCGCYEHCFLPG